MRNNFLIEKYIEFETHYLIFKNDTQEKTIYRYAYKYALTNDLKIQRLIYRDGIYQLTLTPFT